MNGRSPLPDVRLFPVVGSVLTVRARDAQMVDVAHDVARAQQPVRVFDEPRRRGEKVDNLSHRSHEAIRAYEVSHARGLGRPCTHTSNTFEAQPSRLNRLLSQASLCTVRMFDREVSQSTCTPPLHRLEHTHHERMKQTQKGLRIVLIKRPNSLQKLFFH